MTKHAAKSYQIQKVILNNQNHIDLQTGSGVVITVEITEVDNE